MAHWTHRTEHSGGKNGGGFHGTRVEAKSASNIGRRAWDDAAVDEGYADYLDELEDEGSEEAPAA